MITGLSAETRSGAVGWRGCDSNRPRTHRNLPNGNPRANAISAGESLRWVAFRDATRYVFRRQLNLSFARMHSPAECLMTLALPL
jgi:hypothetical protein